MCRRMNQLPCWETKYKARSAARAVRNAFSHMVRRALLLLVQQLSVRTHATVENDNVELNAEWIENDHTGTLQAFTRLFIPLAKNAKRTVVFDVGANDGSWSKWTMRLCSEAFCRRPSHWQICNAALQMCELHAFEPQPRFAERVRNLTASWPRARVNEAAVWKDDKRNLTFYLSRSSVSASLKPVIAHHSGVPRRGPQNITVRTIDLGGYLAAHLPATPSLTDAFVVLKLDIESAEFDLLPHLLSSGVLCRAHLIIIEWHLNALPPERRLAGLGLRLTLSTLLREGCPADSFTLRATGANKRLYGARSASVESDEVVRTPLVLHEGAPINNWEQAVPGLWEVALFHNGTPIPGQQSSRRVAAWETSRRAIAAGHAAGR